MFLAVIVFGRLSNDAPHSPSTLPVTITREKQNYHLLLAQGLF
jgi:hypothetical protein